MRRRCRLCGLPETGRGDRRRQLSLLAIRLALLLRVLHAADEFVILVVDICERSRAHHVSESPERQQPNAPDGMPSRRSTYQPDSSRALPFVEKRCSAPSAVTVSGTGRPARAIAAQNCARASIRTEFDRGDPPSASRFPASTCADSSELFRIGIVFQRHDFLQADSNNPSRLWRGSRPAWASTSWSTSLGACAQYA